MKTAVLVTTDLMFTSRVGQAAKALSIPLRVARDADALAAILAGGPVGLVMVDMALDLSVATNAIRRAVSAASVAKAADAASAGDASPAGAGSIGIVAYYAHVQIELRDAAIDAGATQTMPRSAFVEKLPDLLRTYCAD